MDQTTQQAPVQQSTPVAQPIQPPVQTPVQPSNQPPMKKPVKSISLGKVFSVLFVLLLLVGAGAGGYYLSRPKKVANIAENAYTPQVRIAKRSPTPNSTINAPSISTASAGIDTSSWKTYATNGYTVQYPPTWLIMHTDSIVADSHNAVWIFNPSTMKDESGNGGKTGRQVPSQFITIDQTISTQTPKTYVGLQMPDAKSPLADTVSAMDIKEVTVGGLSGESYVEQGEGSHGRIMVVSNGSALFLFNFSVNDVSQDSIINAILSSFSNK